MADQQEPLNELNQLLSEALAMADHLHLDMIAIRISEALERAKELRAQIPSTGQIKVINNAYGD